MKASEKEVMGDDIKNIIDYSQESGHILVKNLLSAEV